MRLRSGLMVLATCFALHAHAAPDFDTSAANLIAVLRGGDERTEPQETLRPYGKLMAELPDGREVEVEMSWFRYLGDMHIRLVFDSRSELQSASPQDLARLHLKPDEAVQLAVANLRRVYGAPSVQAWPGGLMQVVGRADDLNSSYFLDRAFWHGLEQRFAAGVVVAVPQRGGLLFAPADDDEAVAALRFNATAIYTASRRSRVSSALYLFRDGRWSIYQPPMSEVQ